MRQSGRRAPTQRVSVKTEQHNDILVQIITIF